MVTDQDTRVQSLIGTGRSANVLMSDGQIRFAVEHDNLRLAIERLEELVKYFELSAKEIESLGEPTKAKMLDARTALKVWRARFTSDPASR